MAGRLPALHSWWGVRPGSHREQNGTCEYFLKRAKGNAPFVIDPISFEPCLACMSAFQSGKGLKQSCQKQGRELTVEKRDNGVNILLPVKKEEQEEQSTAASETNHEVHEGELRACAEVMMKMEIDQNGELLLPSSQLLDRGSVALAELENWVQERLLAQTHGVVRGAAQLRNDLFPYAVTCFLEGAKITPGKFMKKEVAEWLTSAEPTAQAKSATAAITHAVRQDMRSEGVKMRARIIMRRLKTIEDNQRENEEKDRKRKIEERENSKVRRLVQTITQPWNAEKSEASLTKAAEGESCDPERDFEDWVDIGRYIVDEQHGSRRMRSWHEYNDVMVKIEGLHGPQVSRFVKAASSQCGVTAVLAGIGGPEWKPSAAAPQFVIKIRECSIEVAVHTDQQGRQLHVNFMIDTNCCECTAVSV